MLSMPGALSQWPAWQEFREQDVTTPQDEDFLKAKQEVIAEYGKAAICQAWLKVCTQLKSITAEIASMGSSAVTVITFEDMMNRNFTRNEERQMKRAGCFVVRNVISEEQTRTLYQNLKQYVADNCENITGWPASSPFILNLYDSPTQLAIRTHPNQLALQRCLNEFWHDTTSATSPKPLLYSDATRIRPPKQQFLGLGPHIDAGSLCRWADPNYRKVYGKILSGVPEMHDCYDLGSRRDANQFLFPGDAHSTVFRSFQGWTALTGTRPHEGSLMLYPNVATVIAYVLLRPFFRPPADRSDIMDANKWMFDSESDWFPGTFKEQSQLLSPSSHPHLRLPECLVSIPEMRPGDTVWWHTDVS